MIKIIFCCLNEEKSLKKLISNLGHEMNLIKKDFEIIICLDGTDDNSIKIINEFQNIYKIKILPQINQRGLGLAYKRLFLEAIKDDVKNDDLIITIDADNTHNPNQIGEMLHQFDKNALDILIASRFCGNSVMDKFPIHRKFISKFTSILLQKIYAINKIENKKLQDYTSGYRIYKTKKLKELIDNEGESFIIEPEFTYTCEILIKLSRLKSRISEIAISYDYGKKIEKSKLRFSRNLYRLIIMINNLRQK